MNGCCPNNQDCSCHGHTCSMYWPCGCDKGAETEHTHTFRRPVARTPKRPAPLRKPRLCIGDDVNHCGKMVTTLWCPECWVDYQSDPDAFK